MDGGSESQDAIRSRNLVLKVIKGHERTNGAIADVNEFINNTLSSHPELVDVPKQVIHSVARKKLDPEGVWLKKEAESSVTPRKVPSLNQAMTNAQKQQQLKRQRPEEPKPANSSSTSPIPPVNGDEAVADAPDRKRRATSSRAPANGSTKTVVVSPFLSERPNMRFSQLAGLDKVIAEMKELVCHPQEYQELYRELGVCPPCGILLHGPSGCGKSALAQATAGETGLSYFKVSGPELVGGTSGESEENIRKVFDAALNAAPSILFIDAFEALAPRRDQNSRGMDRRIIAQLFDCIDTLIQASKEFYQRPTAPVTAPHATPVPQTPEDLKPDGTAPANSAKDGGEKPVKAGFVVLMVATNKPEQLDPGVRGRFAREIALPVPDAPARTSILRLQTQDMKMAPDVDFEQLGKMTPGFVGSDLQVLARQAGLFAVSRLIAAASSASASASAPPAAAASTVATSEEATTDDVSSMDVDVEEKGEETASSSSSSGLDRAVSMEDFTRAIKTVQPTAKREGFAIAPDVSWQDVGALSEVREELKHNVLEPIAHPERFRALGLEVPAGVLFYGPPGCGKTLLAKALANQSGANFISVKGPELLNMYVGESESRVRQVFARARASAPCVIFFDELDALCPRRSSGWDGAAGGSGGGSGNNVSERVVNQLLTELDGLESRRDVYIIAATNRLELIDEAMLRPGRLGNLLYVPLPSASDRVSILRALTRKVAIHEVPMDTATAAGATATTAVGSDVVELQRIAEDSRCDGFTGADLSALVREAGLSVIKELSAANELAMTSGGPNADATTVAPVTKICARHFEMALSKVKPSVSPQDRIRYEKVRYYLKQGLSAIEALRLGYEEAYLNKSDADDDNDNDNDGIDA